MALPGVPFDERRGIVPNEGGRVGERDAGGAVGGGAAIEAVEARQEVVAGVGTGSVEVVPGEYVVGWAKRGPSGVIGTNKADAAATVALMREDLEAGVVAGGGVRGGRRGRGGPGAV